MFVRKSPAGFYFSPFDLAILLGGTMISFWLGTYAWQFGVFAALAVLHFFLFCNIIRIWRPYEILWAATFVLNIYLWMQHGLPDYLKVMMIVIIQLCVTAVVLAFQMRSRHYHGVGWRKLNPGYLNHAA